MPRAVRQGKQVMLQLPGGKAGLPVYASALRRGTPASHIVARGAKTEQPASNSFVVLMARCVQRPCTTTNPSLFLATQ